MSLDLVVSFTQTSQQNVYVQCIVVRKNILLYVAVMVRRIQMNAVSDKKHAWNGKTFTLLRVKLVVSSFKNSVSVTMENPFSMLRAREKILSKF